MITIRQKRDEKIGTHDHVTIMYKDFEISFSDYFKPAGIAVFYPDALDKETISKNYSPNAEGIREAMKDIDLIIQLESIGVEL